MTTETHGTPSDERAEVSELLGCPFCGGAATLHDPMPECALGAWVSCASCGLEGPIIVSGVVIVPLDPERLSSERPVPARKPVGQRVRIPSNPDRKIQSRNTLRKSERLVTP